MSQPRSDLVRLPGLRHQRELRRWSLEELCRRTGLHWLTCKKADDGEPVTMTTASKIKAALRYAAVDELDRELMGAGEAPR